ncbi:hypothetical protein J1N35_012664 [Gossypium stocksii]|uniref:RNase H type-1 domain-containing protein n=1 Tax=Gossypium stocksii TaxID=47602 RepID=A0A9D3W4R6_9ROSI|nr:hypothetical protein J1N35_012664 [Gossypium stocksii]
MAPLISKIPSSSNVDLGCLVKDLVNSDRSWNLDLFRIWLSEDVINKIISIPPPHLNSGADKESGVTWSCLFGLIAWRIWKNRNLFIFQNISWLSTEVMKVSTSWARQFDLYHSGYKNNASFLNHANISKRTWILLSTDGAVTRDFGLAVFGGVVRDSEGNWIMGFGHYLGVCSPFEAKVWGILDGILLPLNKGYRQIIIQTNSLEVVQALKDKGMEETGITVLRMTQHIMKSEGLWRILHIMKSTLQIFDETPKEILDLLQKDKVNGTFM